jgi:short-subunit dehydrogenase
MGRMPRLKLDGATILLTGASSGIGRAMAQLLGPRAGKLALVARRADRLEALRDELKARTPNLAVHVLPCDLSDLDQTLQLLDDVAAQVGHVDVLINNAGVGDYGAYDQVDWERTERMLTLNIHSLALLTHRLVRPMVARGSGGILNVSSGYGLGFTPGFAAYIGSKHFVSSFTESLRLDLHGTGVVVTHVCPGPVKSEFAGRVGYHEGKDVVPGFAYITPEKCARGALRGFERGRAMILSGWVMKLLYFLICTSPRFVKRLAMLPFARAVRRLPPSPGARS